MFQLYMFYATMQSLIYSFVLKNPSSHYSNGCFPRRGVLKDVLPLLSPSFVSGDTSAMTHGCLTVVPDVEVLLRV